MSPEVTAAIIAASVSFLTLIGTLAAQYFGRRATSKQLDRTLAEQRTQTLNERFATAAEQLGSDKPAVRLAGVYAMAGLADDWKEKENRQVCVDVLCAYLRMPYEPDPGQDAPLSQRLAFQASREVRHTVIRVITAHLQKDAAVSWQGLNFDFNGVMFDGGDFRGAEFSGGLAVFDNAEFSGGTVRFNRAKFCGGTVYFGSAKFSGGRVRFENAEFSGGTVSFRNIELSRGAVEFGHAKFSGGALLFHHAQFAGGTVDFYKASFSGGTVDFDDARFTGGRVRFSGARFSDGKVNFARAQFSGGEVDFSYTKFFASTVYFVDTEFSGGTFTFRTALFSGGRVDFGGARFSGSEVDFGHYPRSSDDMSGIAAEFAADAAVDFSQASDWSVPPLFPWTGTPPTGVKLPKLAQQPPGFEGDL